MSNLTQFAPFAGGGLKSFQTGYINSATTAGTPGTELGSYIDVTVSAVTVAKTITNCQGSFYNTSGTPTGCYSTPGPYLGIPQTRMTSTTNLRMSTYNYFDGSVIGRWQVAEAN